MRYKVTPMMGPPVPAKVPQDEQANEPKQGRKRRKSAVFDAEGNEVLLSLMCLKCRQVKPLAQFGLRKMAGGAIRNQPWCRTCRSGAGAPKPKKDASLEASASAESDAETSSPALAPHAEPSVAYALEARPLG